MIFLLALLLSASGPDDFTISIPESPETPDGQLRIARRAMEICAGRYPQLGRYRFTGEETISPDGARRAQFEVEQDLACLESPPPAAEALPRTDDDWRPSKVDEQRVRALTERYFDLFDRGEAAEVHQLWSAGERAGIPLETRAASLAEFRRRAGAPADHRIAAVTWYVNPANAPAPGIYAAVDYERSYANLAANCGYVVWFREADDRYILIREETNILDRSEVAQDPDSIARARALLRCRDG